MAWENEEEKWIWSITYMRHKRKENYEMIGNWIEGNKDNIIIIRRDFNARKRKKRDFGMQEEKRS